LSLRIPALAIAVVAMALFLAIPVTPAVSQATFYVNSTGDGHDANPGDGVCNDGTVVPPPNVNATLQCTLRAAIEEANALTGFDTIAFDIPGEGVHTISPASRLPEINGNVTIDGYTEPGAFEGLEIADSVLAIEVNGLDAGVEASAFMIHGDLVTVRGLIINGWGFNAPLRETSPVQSGRTSPEWPAISIVGDSNTVDGNYIGTNATGTGPGWNGGDGVRILTESRFNKISDNLISANGGNGIAFVNAENTTISRNLIGTDISGTVDLGNQLSGIFIQGDPLVGSEYNDVGGGDGSGNTISGNDRMGVEMTGRSLKGNRIVANYIGTDSSGSLPLGNALGGVSISDAQEWYEANYVGDNVISANGGPGIHFKSTSANAVLGNYIGIDASGSEALGNLGGGVLFEESPGNSLGVYGTFNVISGNVGAGVEIRSQGDLWGFGSNLIGTDPNATKAIGNDIGVKLVNTQEVRVGGNNVISGNHVGVVIEGQSSSGNVVAGSHIGTDWWGRSAIPNGFGVSISGGSSHRIGGWTDADRNVISGNSSSGIVVSGETGYNSIIGNLIGTTADGQSALGNGWTGISVNAGSSRTYIGGSGDGERNVISGNGWAGVSVEGSENFVQGNYIGTDADGESAIPNHTGVHVGGYTNAVGGFGTGEGNVISGNGLWGISMWSGQYNLIAGNHVGTNAAGTGAVPNGEGVSITGGSDSIIGGMQPEGRNVISGNRGHGVHVSGPGWATDIFNNYIGTSPSGGAALGNGGAGIRIADSELTRVGSPDAGNVISGNVGSGIEIEDTAADGAARSTLVHNNRIGTNAAGNAALGNGSDGVALINTQEVTLGGRGPDEGNVISGNRRAGVLISGLNSIYNTVEGNYIGTDASGSQDVGNGEAGVRLADSYYNQIGTEEAGNVISGNDGPGVEIVDTPADGQAAQNYILGNLIGTNSEGTAAIGNRDGVVIDAWANLIGGEQPGDRNVISGNTLTGVRIEGPNAPLNRVTGNYIGTNVAGTAPLGNSVGVLINGATENSIGGGSDQPNVISGNSLAGVQLIGGANRNLIKANFIGTDHSGQNALGNGAGILLSDAHSNEIGGWFDAGANVIAYNAGDGVRNEGNNALFNEVRADSIHSNGAKGIGNVNGGNFELPPPMIDSAGPLAGTACAYCAVEVHSDQGDEGRINHGYTFADAAGNWTFAQPVSGPSLTATATDTSGNTSEFSLPFLLCIDTDADFRCNDADRDDDGDRVADGAEGPCGADPLNVAVRPERTDGQFAGVSDDGDTEVDEPLPPAAAGYDCDGDGFTGATESHVTTSDQDPCGGTGWPSDLVHGGKQPNAFDIQDLASFMAPVRRFGTSPGHPNYNARWDLASGNGIGAAIDVRDLAATITGAGGYPAMFNEQRAFGHTCPWAP
jgi:CSLREA domain-containing protein